MADCLPAQRYVLVHAHASGASSNIFDYQPTEKRPYPDIYAVAKMLGLDIDESRDELELTPVTDDWVEDTFYAPEVGTDELQMFVGPKQFSENKDG